MTAEAFIGIDVGTTAVKALAVSPSGEVLARAQDGGHRHLGEAPDAPGPLIARGNRVLPDAGAVQRHAYRRQPRPKFLSYQRRPMTLRPGLDRMIDVPLVST